MYICIVIIHNHGCRYGASIKSISVKRVVPLQRQLLFTDSNCFMLPSACDRKVLSPKEWVKVDYTHPYTCTSHTLTHTHTHKDTHKHTRLIVSLYLCINYNNYCDVYLLKTGINITFTDNTAWFGAAVYASSLIACAWFRSVYNISFIPHWPILHVR